jgi:hypothetical protein
MSDIPRHDLPKQPFDDEVIMVYADGGLPPDERQAVRDALLEDPEGMRRLESFLYTRGRIAQPFDAVLAAPLPDKLLRMLDQPTKPRQRSEAPLGSGFLERLAAAFSVPTFSLAAAIPSVLVAAAAGWMVHYATPVPLESRGFPASASLQQALESTARGSSAGIVEGVSFKPTFTFATGQKSWCRQYELAYGTSLQSGAIACRSADGVWNVVAQTDPAPPGAAVGSDKTTPAGKANEALDAIRARIKVGDVLARNEELTLMKEQWRRP